MAEKHYKPGDLVQLKSGSPVMTVAELIPGVQGGVKLRCKWFNGKKLETGDFVLEAIKPADQQA